MKPLLYLYYRLYGYYSNGGIIPVFSSLILMLAFLFINMLTIMRLIEVVVLKEKVVFYLFKEENRLVGSLFFLILWLIISYFLFIKDNKTEIIKSMFLNESKKERLWKGWAVLLYFVGSFVLFVVVTQMKS